MTRPPADPQEKERYLRLHSTRTNKISGSSEQLRTAPLISLKVKTASTIQFPQYAFLGCEIPRSDDDNDEMNEKPHQHEPDPVLLNTNTPWSAFICGSQGSGKSYTLSCMLENCLYNSPRIGKLPKPLAGIVFHNDTRFGGSVCEAAYLASLTGIKVNVLVSRSNYYALSTSYEKAVGQNGDLKVYSLILQGHHLNTERMHRLMAFSDSEGSVPLYMEVIMRILREMATKNSPFNYKDFKAALSRETFNPSQKQMMDIRFNLLESFLDMPSINSSVSSKKPTPNRPDIFTPQPGTLTIIDLSDPFLDASTSCLLFDICLSLFSERRPSSGLIVALDEAHKYMNRSSAAEMFTDNLLTTIREQRHNATRVIIATQEPTISPRLLDLCSLTMVHRFTSPDWLMTLKTHLAAASSLTAEDNHLSKLFEQIIELNTGESLLFCPTAYLDLALSRKPQRLGLRYIRFKTRLRLGADGGKSVLALRSSSSSSESEESEEDEESSELESSDEEESSYISASDDDTPVPAANSTKSASMPTTSKWSTQQQQQQQQQRSLPDFQNFTFTPPAPGPATTSGPGPAPATGFAPTTEFTPASIMTPAAMKAAAAAAAAAANVFNMKTDWVAALQQPSLQPIRTRR